MTALDEVMAALQSVQRETGGVVCLTLTVDSDGGDVWWQLGQHEGGGSPWSITGEGPTLEEAQISRAGLRPVRRSRR